MFLACPDVSVLMFLACPDVSACPDISAALSVALSVNITAVISRSLREIGQKEPGYEKPRRAARENKLHVNS